MDSLSLSGRQIPPLAGCALSSTHLEKSRKIPIPLEYPTSQFDSHFERFK